MASITYWNRLEPDPRSKSLTRSLAAEIRDPLWLLCRQWQLGEFQGEDVATSMSMEIETETFDFTTFGPVASPTALQPYVPLEPQVQREPYTPDLATRVEMSHMWSRLITQLGFDFRGLPRAVPPAHATAYGPSRRSQRALSRLRHRKSLRWFCALPRHPRRPVEGCPARTTRAR